MKDYKPKLTKTFAEKVLRFAKHHGLSTLQVSDDEDDEAQDVEDGDKQDDDDDHEG